MNRTPTTTKHCILFSSGFQTFDQTISFCVRVCVSVCVCQSFYRYPSIVFFYEYIVLSLRKYSIRREDRENENSNKIFWMKKNIMNRNDEVAKIERQESQIPWFVYHWKCQKSLLFVCMNMSEMSWNSCLAIAMHKFMLWDSLLMNCDLCVMVNFFSL